MSTVCLATANARFVDALHSHPWEETCRSAYLDHLFDEGVWDGIEERVGEERFYVRGDDSVFAGPALRCAKRLFREHPRAMFVIYSDDPPESCGFSRVDSSPVLYYRPACRSEGRGATVCCVEFA
jgi:hypothetical protein